MGPVPQLTITLSPVTKPYRLAISHERLVKYWQLAISNCSEWLMVNVWQMVNGKWLIALHGEAL